MSMKGYDYEGADDLRKRAKSARPMWSKRGHAGRAAASSQDHE